MTDPGGGPVARALGLRRDYGREAGLVRAVDGVDLELATGETLAVIGPSGCGKSTLLHLLGGLDRPSGGEVWIGGQRLDQMSEKALARVRREMVGFVFQAFHLMDELTAVENVELPALLAGRSPHVARRQAMTLLERTGLSMAVMRGTEYRPADSFGALVAQAAGALRGADRAMVTVYHGQLDGTGHTFGAGSDAWRCHLGHVDKLA